MGVLDYYRQQRSQGKGSAYNFVLVLQRLADPFFAASVPVRFFNDIVNCEPHSTLGHLRKLPRNNATPSTSRYHDVTWVCTRSRNSSAWRDRSALPQPPNRISWFAVCGLPRARRQYAVGGHRTKIFTVGHTSELFLTKANNSILSGTLSPRTSRSMGTSRPTYFSNATTEAIKPSPTEGCISPTNWSTTLSPKNMWSRRKIR